MNRRQLIEALTQPQPALRGAPTHPLRPCPCDIDPVVFGHTLCGQAAVQRFPGELMPGERRHPHTP